MRRRKTFAKSPQSVSAARGFARDTLLDLPPEALEVCELMVSELATNCVRHSRTAFEVVIARRRDEVRIEVSDRAGGRPTVRSPGPEEPSGRGLKIVDMLSDAWGVDYLSDRGKTVWCIVSATAASAA